jgi:hypothetical protein
MALRDDLHTLVDALSDEQAPLALTYLRHLTTAADPLSARMGPAFISGQAFLTRPPASADALAAAQGVGPIESPEALVTDLWPTDPEEDPDRFVETLRQWRRDERHAS